MQQPCVMTRPLTFVRGKPPHPKFGHVHIATSLEKGERVLGGFPTITILSNSLRNRPGQDKDLASRVDSMSWKQQQN